MSNTNAPSDRPMTRSLFFPTTAADTASELLAAQQNSTGPAVPAIFGMDLSTTPEIGAVAVAAAEEGMAGSQQKFDEMTVEELQMQKDEVERKILAKREADRRAAMRQIIDLVNTHNIPIDELVDALGGLKRKLGPAVQKYRDPETGLTWSGRGKEPLWLRGKERTQFLIP